MEEHERGNGWFSGLSLSGQFLAAAAVVLCLSMAVLGTWINRQVTRSILAVSGSAGAAFLDAFVEPLIQDIGPDGRLPAGSHKALDALLFDDQPIRRSIISVKIWQLDGTVIYVNKPKDLIGQKYTSTDVTKAASGEIIAEFDDMTSGESAHERQLGLPTIEVYAPLHRNTTGEVIAVGEIYENAEILAAQLELSVMRTWIVVCFTTLVMLAVLYLIVRRGSRLISSQRAELQARFRDSQQLAATNEDLRLQAERARLDANAANEELIGRIGLDLHDGPIQILSLLMLRLGRLRKDGSARENAANAAVIEELTAGVIHELRVLSAGLVLPEIGDLGVGEAIRLAAERHENLTGTRVDVVFGDLPEHVTGALKICIYRIVQESLSNAFKHAGGAGQRVRAELRGANIGLQISDSGGLASECRSPAGDGSRLGLRGIQSRVETFSGTLVIRSDAGGTVVDVELPISKLALIKAGFRNVPVL
ncbi:sensor histidine kinase [Shinella zoogloeoides]|uniref:sensor histidine kinase n=1 Tax=Shinella zoogloeoides TaxID=352475 RepID=UPI0013C34053|nr:ATP-binding protein [Shinella zoogloeoides]